MSDILVIVLSQYDVTNNTIVFGQRLDLTKGKQNVVNVAQFPFQFDLKIVYFADFILLSNCNILAHFFNQVERLFSQLPS